MDSIAPLHPSAIYIHILTALAGHTHTYTYTLSMCACSDSAIVLAANFFFFFKILVVFVHGACQPLAWKVVVVGGVVYYSGSPRCPVRANVKWRCVSRARPRFQWKNIKRARTRARAHSVMLLLA